MALAEAGAPKGTRVTTHICDVSDEASVLAFRAPSWRSTATHRAPVQQRRHRRRRQFHHRHPRGLGADLRGRLLRRLLLHPAFLPLLIAADEARLVNTSSVNGFWASIGPGVPHTAYSTASLRSKGLSEALIEDLRVNAPHVGVSVVMPGHIGTDIVANTRRYSAGSEPTNSPKPTSKRRRERVARMGVAADHMTADNLRGVVKMIEEGFRNNAPLERRPAPRP